MKGDPVWLNAAPDAACNAAAANLPLLMLWQCHFSIGTTTAMLALLLAGVEQLSGAS